MNKKKIIIISVIVIAVIILSILCYSYIQSLQGFKINSVFVKSVIKQGESSTNNVVITSYLNENFNAKLEGLDSIASLSEENFKAVKGQAKELTITFSSEDEIVKPGVYIGTLTVTAAKKQKKIPVILEVQSQDVLFAVNIDHSPDSKEVVKGEKVTTSVRLFNLYDTKTHEVEVHYAVKGLDNYDILSEKEIIVVGTELVTVKTITMPKDIALGYYVLTATTRFNDSIGTSSYLFSVVQNKNRPAAGFNINTFALVILVFLLLVVVLVIYTIRERNRQLMQLEKRHAEELKLIVTQLEERKKLSLSRARSAKEKKNIIKVFKKIKRKAITNVRQKQRVQSAEIARLKKLNKKSEMRQKLKQWKKEGFNVNELLVKISAPKTTDKAMREQLEKWKKEGYDASVIKSQNNQQ